MAVLSDSFFATRRRYVQRSLHNRRHFISVIVLLCLMSLLTLGQTGVVATKGYAVAKLQSQRKTLIRERDQQMVYLATLDSMDRIRERADMLGLRPVHLSQVQYVTLVDKAQKYGTSDTDPNSEATPKPGVGSNPSRTGDAKSRRSE